MHLVTILAYAVLFWRATGPDLRELAPIQSTIWTWIMVLAQPAVFGLAAALLVHRTRRRLRFDEGPPAALEFYHRTMLILHAAHITAFAFVVFATPWTHWFRLAQVTPELQILGDLIVLLPFFAGAISIWVATFPLERAIRLLGRAATHPQEAQSDWTLRQYLDFNVRHHLLVVAVPMTLILFAADVAYGYESSLRERTGWIWTPDAVLGAFACLVFVIAPILLRRIWRTRPLDAGSLRTRLEELCRAIPLKVRDILVWESDGLMINAAVMGVAPRVRYVLLSDALLSAMTPEQVEAVFGHEAGHVRHHHIPHFLAFALIGWLVAAAAMELSALLAVSFSSDPGQWLQVVQAVGVVVTLLFWGLGFGWLSRRFERQADMFAAQCVASGEGKCIHPCSVHRQGIVDHPHARVCSTGALVFASALNQVATMSGIPREEPSWRHSSIASRIRFLLSLANDPAKARRFDRLLGRVKKSLALGALAGMLAAVCYWRMVPDPAILRMQQSGGSLAARSLLRQP